MRPAEPAPKVRLEVAITRCEGQIAALQRALGEIAGTSDEHLPAAHQRQESAALEDRIGSLESRVIEQERTLRHTLTMLIEWIEQGESHGVAA